MVAPLLSAHTEAAHYNPGQLPFPSEAACGSLAGLRAQALSAHVTEHGSNWRSLLNATLVSYTADHALGQMVARGDKAGDFSWAGVTAGPELLSPEVPLRTHSGSQSLIQAAALHGRQGPAEACSGPGASEKLSF